MCLQARVPRADAQQQQARVAKGPRGRLEPPAGFIAGKMIYAICYDVIYYNKQIYASLSLSIYIYMYVCMYIYIYVYTCIYIYIYIHKHIHTYTHTHTCGASGGNGGEKTGLAGCRRRRPTTGPMAAAAAPAADASTKTRTSGYCVPCTCEQEEFYTYCCSEQNGHTNVFECAIQMLLSSGAGGLVTARLVCGLRRPVIIIITITIITTLINFIYLILALLYASSV